MKYSYEEGNFRKGDILGITIDRKVNIYLLDSDNFIRYRNNNSFKYYGGSADSSPYTITVPSSGHWYIVIDLGGGAGILNYSIKVFR